MSLVAHAKRELEISGAGEDYDGMIGGAVLELIEIFAKQGHSGYSAMVTLSVFDHLARFKPLSDLTNDPDEWMKVSGPNTDFPEHEESWQSIRRPDAFSNDGGITYTLLDDEVEGTVYQSERRIPCPNDTNGDGDCGKQYCPYCGEKKL